MADKEKLKQLGDLSKELDALIKEKQRLDKQSDKLGRIINKKMLEFEKLTEKTYNKKPFTTNVQEI